MSGKSLSQVETIRSLGEALAWFQRELSWGVAPSALPHLTGRIGELFAAVTMNGEMATAVNQRGYDIQVRETNLRVSVKTVTSSNHVTFKASTFDLVDRVLVLKIDVEGDEVTIKAVLDEPADRAKGLCSTDAGGNYTYTLRSRGAPIRPLEQIDVRDEARFGSFHIKQYVNGTVVVDRDGVLVSSAISALREIAVQVAVSPLNSNDNPRNTRQLGAEVIAAIKAREEPAQTST